MFAKNLMAAMMLSSLLGFTSVSLADTRIPPSAVGGIRTDLTGSTSVLDGVFYLVNMMRYSLPYEDQATHTKTLILAAQSLENGQIAEWINPSNSTAGRTKIILTRPVRGGFCRLLYTEIEIKDRYREYSEYACKTIDSEYWSFHTAK